ncbi:MAG: LysR substrate-binding domain-containing protein [Pseudomonadota bacterium]
MDKLAAMRSFLAVATEGSFTAAGRRLGISTKLASKHVQDLEAHLRSQLFNRTTRSVALTDVGQAYLERCRPILEQLDDLDALVREKQERLAGPIRVTAPTSFGGTELPAALADFLSRHPEVEVELKLTDSRVALVEEGVDLAVRIGALRDSTLVVKKLSDMPMVVCAAPDYLTGYGRPRAPQALSTHRCLIDENVADARIWRFQRGREACAVDVRGPVRANAPGAIARLAEGGLGVARLPAYVVAGGLAAGRLEPLLPDWRTLQFGLYALYPPNRHLTTRVRALIDHLDAHFARRWEGAAPAD